MESSETAHWNTEGPERGRSVPWEMTIGFAKNALCSCYLGGRLWQASELSLSQANRPYRQSSIWEVAFGCEGAQLLTLKSKQGGGLRHYPGILSVGLAEEQHRQREGLQQSRPWGSTMAPGRVQGRLQVMICTFAAVLSSWGCWAPGDQRMTECLLSVKKRSGEMVKRSRQN